jgi:hypothetical protein
VSSLVALLLMAGPFSSSDFEVGFGNWSEPTNTGAHTMTLSVAAAHRGAMGLRAHDQRLTSESSAGPLSKHVLPANQQRLYSRLWARWSNIALGSDDTLFMGVYRSAPSSTVAGVNLSPGSPNTLVLDSNTTVILADGGQGGPINTIRLFPDGGLNASWHLIETYVETKPGNTVDVALACDGVLVAGPRRMASSFGPLTYAELGFIYEYGVWSGDLDIDDVRLSTDPMPSKFAVSGPSQVAQGSCVPFSVSLVSSFDGGLAPAFANTPFAPNVTGGVAYGTPTCQIGPFAFTPDASVVQIGVLFGTPGRATLSATDPQGDLLPSAVLSVTVVAPDAGPGVDAGPPTLGPARRLGVGCSAVPSTECGLAAVVLLHRARRRARQPRLGAWRNCTH